MLKIFLCDIFQKIREGVKNGNFSDNSQNNTLFISFQSDVADLIDISNYELF